MPFSKEAIAKIKYLDGEELFRKYCEMGKAGSIKKLIVWCVENGKISPTTGKAPAPMSIHSAMWRWALAHEKEAREMYGRLRSEYGEFLDDATWYGELKHWALMKYNKAKCVRYFNLHPEIKDATETHLALS